MSKFTELSSAALFKVEYVDNGDYYNKKAWKRSYVYAENIHTAIKIVESDSSEDVAVMRVEELTSVVRVDVEAIPKRISGHDY